MFYKKAIKPYQR